MPNMQTRIFSEAMEAEVRRMAARQTRYDLQAVFLAGQQWIHWTPKAPKGQLSLPFDPAYKAPGAV